MMIQKIIIVALILSVIFLNFTQQYFLKTQKELIDFDKQCIKYIRELQGNDEEYKQLLEQNTKKLNYAIDYLNNDYLENTNAVSADIMTIEIWREDGDGNRETLFTDSVEIAKSKIVSSDYDSK